MIPEGWKEVRLGEIASIKRGAGSQYLTYVDSPSEGVRLIRIGDFLSDDPKYVLQTDEINRFILQEGDLLIAGTGATAGITFEVPDDFIGFAFSYNAPRIRVGSRANKKFIIYALKSEYTLRQQQALFTGNAQPFLDTVAIGGFRIPLPPMAEQDKIAEILFTWDRAIEATEKLIANSQAQKKALMQQLLTGKKRLPGFSGEWRNITLREIGVMSSAGVDKKIVEGEPIVRLLNFVDVYKREFLFAREMMQEVSAPAPKVAQCNVKKGDIFFTPSSETRHDIGLCAVAAEDMPGVVYSYHVIRLRPGIALDQNFSAYLFQTDAFRVQTYSAGDGSGQRYVISQDAFRDMTVELPTIEEQRAIGLRLREASLLISSLEEEVARLKLEKSALMQQLLTGKRRVKLVSGQEAAA